MGRHVGKAVGVEWAQTTCSEERLVARHTWPPCMSHTRGQPAERDGASRAL